MNAQLKKGELPFSFLKSFLHLFSFGETRLDSAKHYVEIHSGTKALRRDWQIVGNDIHKSMKKLEEEMELQSSKLECVE